MKYIDRDGNAMQEDSNQDQLLKLLYTHVIGRMLLKILVKPCISKMGGWLLSQPCSKMGIKPFVIKQKIDLSLYQKQNFDSYNDFFTRQIKKENRPFQGSESTLLSPCDGKLSVYDIRKGCKFNIKNTVYSLESLLDSKFLAKKYEGGYACVFRLTVDDYHRFSYVDDGKKSENYRIPGVFHTVNPIANEKYPIYKKNTREYSLLKSKHFKTILMMEVGALLVGKITNYHGACQVKRGQEKGQFEFGGSTVILLFQKDAVTLDSKLLYHTQKEYETIVRMGDRLGEGKFI